MVQAEVRRGGEEGEEWKKEWLTRRRREYRRRPRRDGPSNYAHDQHGRANDPPIHRQHVSLSVACVSACHGESGSLDVRVWMVRPC